MPNRVLAPGDQTPAIFIEKADDNESADEPNLVATRLLPAS
jgi:hypothetical protein